MAAGGAQLGQSAVVDEAVMDECLKEVTKALVEARARGAGAARARAGGVGRAGPLAACTRPRAALR